MRLQRLQRTQNTKVDDNLIEQSRPEQALHHRSLFCRLFLNRGRPRCSNYITVDQLLFGFLCFSIVFSCFSFRSSQRGAAPGAQIISLSNRAALWSDFIWDWCHAFRKTFLMCHQQAKLCPMKNLGKKVPKKRRGEGEGEQHQWREMVTIRGALNSPSVPSTPQQPKAQAQLLPGAPASTLRRDDLFFAWLKKTLKDSDMMIILRRDYLWQGPP